MIVYRLACTLKSLITGIGWVDGMFSALSYSAFLLVRALAQPLAFIITGLTPAMCAI